MSRVVIVNYGMGNIGSAANAFERLGARCLVSDDPKVLDLARGIVLPGVGAFHAAVENIRSRGLDDALSEQVRTAPVPSREKQRRSQDAARPDQEVGQAEAPADCEDR